VVARTFRKQGTKSYSIKSGYLMPGEKDSGVDHPGQSMVAMSCETVDPIVNGSGHRG
jgi:hypothetical protein